MRKVVLSVAAAAGTLGFTLLTACSSSSEGPAADAGAETGIIRRADSGGGTGDGGGVGAVVAPAGTQVLSSPSAYLEGVTDDGFAIYQDTTSNSLYAVSISTPSASPTTITTQGTDYMAGLLVYQTVVFMLSGTSNSSKVGHLSVWTSATGTKELSPLSTIDLLDLTNDNTKIVYYDNVSEVGGALQTGDLTVANIDGTNKSVLAQGVTLQGGPCNLQGAQVVFVGDDLVALSCTPMSDGGTPMVDAGDDDGGSLPPETLTLYQSPNYTPPMIISAEVANGVSFGSDRGVGKPGAQVLFQTGTSLVSEVIATKAQTTITNDPTWTASYSTDGSQVLYVTQVGSAIVTSIASPSSPTMLTTGNYNYIAGESPDPKSEFALIATSEARDPMSGVVTSSDLYLLSTTAANTPTAITSMPTAALYGQGFTADSNYAVFDENVTGGVGAILVQSTSGSGGPQQLGTNSWIDDEPTGSLVIFNVNCLNCTTMYVPGQADIQYVDLSKGMTPTTLVTQADYNFYLTKDKSKVVYSWHPTQNGDAGASQAGVWVWPLP